MMQLIWQMFHLPWKSYRFNKERVKLEMENGKHSNIPGKS